MITTHSMTSWSKEELLDWFIFHFNLKVAKYKSYNLKLDGYLSVS